MEEDDALFVHTRDETFLSTTEESPPGLSREAGTTVDSTTVATVVSDLMEKLTTEIKEMLTTNEYSSTPYVNREEMTTDYPNTYASSTEGAIVGELRFSFIDYGIFALLLALSTLIGVYFGFISKRKQNNTTEYLLGGKTMNKFPVSASLIATHISGITLLGVPSEIYANGTQYWVFIVCALSVSSPIQTFRINLIKNSEFQLSGFFRNDLCLFTCIL